MGVESGSIGVHQMAPLVCQFCLTILCNIRSSHEKDDAIRLAAF
jgi:hypothetical protein